MAGRTSDLVVELAKVDDRPAATVNMVARQCRLIGAIGRDAPGRGAGTATLEDAANLVIAANASENPLSGARLVPLYRALVPSIGWIASCKDDGVVGREYQRVPDKFADLPPVARLLAAETFGQALEALIEVAPGLAYLNMHDPAANIGRRARMWGDTVTFRRLSTGVSAEIRIGSAAQCVYALDIANPYDSLPETVRKVEVTIGLRVFVALNAIFKEQQA